MNDTDYNLLSPSSVVELIYHENGSTTTFRKKRNYQYKKFPSISRNYKGKSIQKGFTTKSRNNLSRILNSINVEKLEFIPKFVTLTYCDEVLKERQKNSLLKNDLHKLQKWLSYHYPTSTGFWKLENQSKRFSKNPHNSICYHFHLLVYGVNFISETKLNKWWNKTTNSPVKQITEVQDVRDGNDIKDYITKKYISKDDGWYKFKSHNLGRIWGSFSKSKLQEYIDPKVVEIVSNQTIQGELYQSQPDVEVLYTDKSLDKIHHNIKKDIIRFKDSYSRFKWNKKYRKNYHYYLIKEEYIDYDTGEILERVKFHRLREDRLFILLSNKTLSNLIDHHLERNFVNPIHYKINQRFLSSKKNN